MAIVVAVAAVAAAVAAIATSAVVVIAPRGITVNNPLQAGSVAAPAAADTLTVVGSGAGNAAPDQARVTLGVAPERGGAPDAVNTAAAEMTKLLGTLHDQGVADADIQTTSISVNQDFNCCPRAVSGYVAETDVTVLIHHLNNVGAVIAAATQAIGNDIRINTVTLSVSDPTAAVQAARKAAVADAAARAKEWASLSGRQLGRMLGLSEVVGTQPVPVCTGGCGGGGIPVSPGQATVTVTVTVSYQLNG